MDQESKQFIEASFEKWTGIVMSEFGKVNGRLDGMDSRFDAMDSRFDAMDSRFDAMDSRFDSLEGRVSSLEEDMAETKAVVIRIEHTLQDKMEGQEDAILSLEKRTNRLEDKVGLPHVLAV